MSVGAEPVGKTDDTTWEGRGLDRRVNVRAQRVLESRGGWRRPARLLPFLGPAFIASVAYIDPGNYATNIQGGAEFGYRLLWVVLWANLMAMLVQTLSAKLGIATGKNLPEVIRERYPRPLVRFYWIQSEFVAIATDLAEFLGAALGFQLLLGIPLVWGAVLAAVATFAILTIEGRGFRPLETVIIVLVAVIALAYVLEIIFSRPDAGAVATGMLLPTFHGSKSVYLATGILGATVMPHVIYLHSALTQRRIAPKSTAQAKRLYRFAKVDVIIAMGIAGFVNMAMLAMSAATFHFTGNQSVADISTAYRTLTPLLGAAASTVFAVSLLASGVSSSVVGTMAGQTVMQGFVGFTIPVWLRRVITLLPSFVVVLLGLDPTTILVLSQVVLSFGIALALVPLLLFLQDRAVVGEFVNGTFTRIASWSVAVLIIVLNVYLLITLG
ncbi:MAG TPA: Nramp family divalent metal transporter [Trueperaceae bacterium]|nr:Nramp family divalent metal transporter [Trueperaceae bacterium]